MTGIATPHQCQRASGIIPCSTNLCERQEGDKRSHEDRQYNSSIVYQPNGRNPFQEAHGDHSSDVELEFGEGYNTLRRAHSWQTECSSRPGVTNEKRQFRMETGSNYLSPDQGIARPMSGGPFRLQTIFPAPKIYELETRSRSDCYRCSEPTLEGYKGLCLPSIFTDWQMPVEDQEEGSSSADPHCSSMVNPNHGFRFSCQCSFRSLSFY